MYDNKSADIMTMSSSYSTIDHDDMDSVSSYSENNDNLDNNNIVIVDEDVLKEETYGKKSLKHSDLVEFDIKTYGNITKRNIIEFVICVVILVLLGIPLFYFIIENKPYDGFCKIRSNNSYDSDDYIMIVMILMMIKYLYV